MHNTISTSKVQYTIYNIHCISVCICWRSTFVFVFVNVFQLQDDHRPCSIVHHQSIVSLGPARQSAHLPMRRRPPCGLLCPPFSLGKLTNCISPCFCICICIVPILCPHFGKTNKLQAARLPERPALR